MKETLKELVRQEAELEQAIIDSYGEVTPEIEERLKEIDLKIPEKVDRYHMFMEGLRAKAAERKRMAEELLEVSKGLEKALVKCQDYMLYVMNETGNPLLEGTFVKFRKSSSLSVNVDDLEKVPKEFVKERVSRSADKTAIKSAIREGKHIPGVTVEENFGIRKYSKKD